MRQLLIIILFSPIVFTACKPEEDTEPINGASFRGFVVPAHFPPPHYDFTGNAVTKEKFELGKMIFYDPNLSSDGQISCASCHDQVHGFSDHNMPVSTGVEGRLGKRNSPTIANLAWNSSFMHDGGINHIEVQPVAAFTDPNEMNETMAGILEKMRSNADYVSKFNDAFGSEEITDKRLLQALAQFTAMLVSSDSKYDRVKLGREQFTTEEARGYQLFLTNCDGCHKGPLFTDYSFRNNGLDTYTDEGRYRITQNEMDRAKFKVPTLRNVALTYPYMHDGRIRSLRNVLDHYSDGIKSHPSLDTALVSGIPLSEQDKRDIVSFLTTLSDFTLAANPLFAQP